MLQVLQVKDHSFMIFVSGCHCKVLDDIAEVAGVERIDVIGRVLSICLDKKSMDIIVKGIKDGLEGQNEGMGRR